MPSRSFNLPPHPLFCTIQPFLKILAIKRVWEIRYHLSLVPFQLSFCFICNVCKSICKQKEMRCIYRSSLSPKAIEFLTCDSLKVNFFYCLKLRNDTFTNHENTHTLPFLDSLFVYMGSLTVFFIFNILVYLPSQYFFKMHRC